MSRRILHVMGRSAGGIARHVAQVVGALDGRDGLTLDVAGPPDLPVPMPKHVLPIVVPDGPTPGHVWAVAQIRRLMGGYDLVHGHGLRAGLDAGLAVSRSAKPAVVTMHNLVRNEVSGRMRGAAYRRLEPLAVRLSRITFAPSEAIAEHLRAAAPAAADRIEVLYLGVDEAPVVTRTPAEVRAELGIPAGARIVVTASRLAPQKDLPTMLAAVASLPDDVALVVVGEGPLRSDLEDAAERLRIADRVRFAGFRPDVADFIAAADAFCLSSVWEAVALAAKEAIVLGVPVVATDAGGMRELIVDGSSGRLVPVGDPGALAGALGDVLASETVRRSYALNARRALGERFSAEAMIEKLRRAYLEIESDG